MAAQETNETVLEFHRAATALMDALLRGVTLNGDQENTVVDTLRDLQLAYAEWLKHTPIKEQSFPADGEK